MARAFLLVLRAFGLAVALACGIASPAAASPMAAQRLSLCVARDAGQAAAAMIGDPRRFDCRTRQFDFGPGSYWMRARDVPPATGIEAMRIRTASQWQARLTLYVRYRDGRIVAFPLDGRGMTRHMQLGAMIEQALPDRHVAVDAIMWRVEGSGNVRRILGDSYVATPVQSLQDNLEVGILYAAFVGLGSALFAYNLALWVGLRRRFQLAYCAMVASLVAYAGTSSGAVAWLLPALPNNLRIALAYLLLATSTATALWFARTFFEPVGLPRWLDRGIAWLGRGLLGTGVCYLLLEPVAVRVLDQIQGLAYLGVLAVTVPLMVEARRRGPAFLLIFALAWTAPAMLTAMRVANGFRLSPVIFSLQNSTLALMTVEALLSSVAIAYRIHLLGRERDEAREQEIVARMLADTDPLTGLMNRRAFLHQAIGRRDQQQLLLIDIDHFKRINETIGHDGGDEVLRVIARALRGAIPAGALVARIGGEEFAIVMAAAAAPPPAAILDSLRQARMPFDLAVTASMGVCRGALLRETDWKRLYRHADRALFAAKAAGRDRARDAGTLPPEAMPVAA